MFKLLDNVTQGEGKEHPNFTKDSRVLIIDGLNLFFRNFAVLNFINPKGVHIGGIGGFLRSLGSLVKLVKPTAVYVVFDGVNSSLNRKNLIPEYKSERGMKRITKSFAFDNLQEENDAKVNQIRRLIHYLDCLPVKVISIPKSEADDVISHLSTSIASKDNSKVYIVSADNDFIQLVNDKITLYSPIKKLFFTEKTIEENFGLPAKNHILYKSLLGDNSDKLKGVKGLGKGKLYKLFPTLQTEIMSLDDIFKICEEKYKDHVIYSRIILDKEDIQNKYKIMDLSNPIIDDNGIEELNNLIDSTSLNLQIDEFVKMHLEDGLGHLVANPSFWIRENFQTLKNYK